MIHVHSVTDLRTYLDDVRADLREHGLLDAVVEAMRASAHPPWGSDWRVWLETNQDALIGDACDAQTDAPSDDDREWDDPNMGGVDRDDDTPDCNCGTCTPPAYTCIRND